MCESARRARFFLAALLLAWPTGVAAQGAPERPAPELLAQIRALEAEKASRSPSQRRVSSRLLHAATLRRGLAIAPGVPSLRTEVEVDEAGATLIDVRGDVTPALLARIEELGGDVIGSYPRFQALRARLRLDEVERLAELPEVRFVGPADRAITRKIDTTQGDVAHRADLARQTFGASGAAIAVGVLSDGVDALASLQASGDLPAVTVLPGQAGSGSEGTAMLEIVHDLAPGAELLFGTAFGSAAAFASNILALRAAGADVLVDDVAYFSESVFQDDVIAQAVNEVTAAGALYFSAAGNEGNLDDGTAGVWEGDYVASTTTVGGAPAHDFGGGLVGNEITADSPFVFTLHWADPKGGSANDYDLYLANKPLTVIVAASTDVQDGNDDPFEIIGSSLTNDRGRKLLVVRSAGAGRYLHVNANRGRLAAATAGQTSGHSAARAAFGVAAVDVADAAGPGGVFGGSESVETYSSDGPRRVFYEADGTPITPGDFSSTGGEVRQKPDLAAADCVSTATPGFGVFCGTSAAAPHAAAIGALLLELSSGGTPEEIRSALAGSALDIEATGIDRDSGAGIADAFAAAEALDRSACENGTDDDGDGRVDFPDDPGCESTSDDSERSAAIACDDGLDDDGDGFTDFSDSDGDGVSDPPGDPGCRDPSWPKETPQCQDGIDNDGRTGIDFDGGASLNSGVPLDVADPQCSGQPWRDKEAAATRCGLGFEVVLLLVFLLPVLGQRRDGGRTGRPGDPLERVIRGSE